MFLTNEVIPKFRPGGQYIYPIRSDPPVVVMEKELQRQRYLQEIIKTIPKGDCADGTPPKMGLEEKKEDENLNL